MKIAVVGTGYDGLVTGACLGEVGNEVLCTDVDDSAAIDETRRVYCDRADLTLVEAPMDTLDRAGVLLRATEWKAFRNANSETMKSLLKSPVVFDGRNLHDPAAMRAQGFEYVLIGQRT